MLTDTKVRQAKPRESTYKLTDGGGLYLHVSPSGAKSWRYDYRIGGKRETLTVGPYPQVSVADARDRHQEARKLVERGESPAQRKKADKAAKRFEQENSVKAVAEAWYSSMAPHRSESWKDNTERWLKQDIYPGIGPRPITTVTHCDVAELIKRVAGKRGARSAHYARQTLARVFRYAKANGLKVENHAREAVGVVVQPESKGHPSLSQKDIPGFIETLDGYPGRLGTKLALKLLMLTFVRKLELLNATWDEMDLEEAQWRIPGERMKMRDEHIVPLSRQAVEAFKDLKEVSCGSRYVLPNVSTLEKPMSPSTVNVAIERMGYAGRFTPHGFRATASTILNELGFRPDVIERQLAHTERNRVRAAYNRAEYLEERRHMMQAWANFLDALVAGDNVVGFRRASA